jgi:hypothetical protein
MLLERWLGHGATSMGKSMLPMSGVIVGGVGRMAVSVSLLLSSLSSSLLLLLSSSSLSTTVFFDFFPLAAINFVLHSVAELAAWEVESE